jgi:hypothetical protein
MTVRPPLTSEGLADQNTRSPSLRVWNSPEMLLRQGVRRRSTTPTLAGSPTGRSTHVPSAPPCCWRAPVRPHRTGQTGRHSHGGDPQRPGCPGMGGEHTQPNQRRRQPRQTSPVRHRRQAGVGSSTPLQCPGGRPATHHTRQAAVMGSEATIVGRAGAPRGWPTVRTPGVLQPAPQSHRMRRHVTDRFRGIDKCRLPHHLFLSPSTSVRPRRPPARSVSGRWPRRPGRARCRRRCRAPDGVRMRLVRRGAARQGS